MKHLATTMLTPIRHFLRHEDGVATMDWVIICSGATAIAVAVLNIGRESVTGYTDTVRNEVQTPYFNTDWTSTLEIPPQELWADQPPIIPVPDDLPQGGPLDDLMNQVSGDDDDDPDPTDPTDPTDPNDPTDPADPDPPSDPYGIANLVIPSGPVVGCPTIDYAGPVSTRTGTQLANTDLLVDVNAGGATHLGNCPGMSGWGFFNANPSITLFLSGMDAMIELEIETRNSCDTVLLVRDALGRYYFDDDGGRDFSAYASRIKIRADNGVNMSTLNGRLDVWVGTYAGNTCNNVRVEIDTID